MNAKLFRLLLNLYPPYLGTGIVVTRVSADYREIVVRMKLRWYNRNYVKTHFGGSLYSMTDPFFMLMLLQNLGKDYVVWDKGARIEFVKAGKGTVTARFQLTEAQLDDILMNTADGQKYLPDFVVDVEDETRAVVARVTKTLHVRKKPVRQTTA